MTDRPKIPGGSMGVAKARKRWADIRRAVETGDLADMRTAVSRFEGIAETMFLYWEEDRDDTASEARASR